MTDTERRVSIVVNRLDGPSTFRSDTAEVRVARSSQITTSAQITFDDGRENVDIFIGAGLLEDLVRQLAELHWSFGSVRVVPSGE